MEMLIVVGFFIACASVCVLVFVKADSVSQEARDMNQAALMAETLAEELKVGALSGGTAKALEAEGSEMLPDREIWEYLVKADGLLDEQQAEWIRELRESEGYEGVYTLYRDSLWQPIQPVSTPSYLGVVSLGTVDNMRRADILIMCYKAGGDKGKVLCRIQTETYEKP